MRPTPAGSRPGMSRAAGPLTPHISRPEVCVYERPGNTKQFNYHSTLTKMIVTSRLGNTTPFAWRSPALTWDSGRPRGEPRFLRWHPAELMAAVNPVLDGERTTPMSNAKGRPAAQRRAPQHRSNTGRHREAARTIGELAGAPAAMPTAAKIATASVVGTSAALAVPAAAFASPAGGHAGPPVVIIQPPAPQNAAPGPGSYPPGYAGPVNTGKLPSANPSVVIQPPAPQNAVPGPGSVPPGYAGPVNTGKWPSSNPPGLNVVVEQPTGASVTGCAGICVQYGQTPPDANGKGVVRFGVGAAIAPPAVYIDPLAASEGASAKVEVTGSTSTGL